MDFKAYISQLNEQIKKFWSSATIIHKSIIGGVILAIFGGIIALISFSNNDKSEYLFVDLSQEDTTSIVNFLTEKGNIKYSIDQKGIKVPPEDVMKLRIELSQAGLPSQGIVGWEKFDKTDFTRTEFEQNIQKKRAIEGELARTILAIEGITSARVHITQPKSSVFIRDEKKPTASIYIKTKRGVQLDQKQIRGIQHLVAGSIEGLETNDINIVDSDGRMLTQAEPTESTAKMTKEKLEYREKIESQLEKKIRLMVGRHVGADRIEATVDAEVDFTQEKQLISDVDPDDIAVLSKNTSGFSMEGSGLNPTGIPGAKSNVPGEEENTSGTTNKAGSKRDTELVNYEVSKIRSEKTFAVGDIKGLSISVLVDGKQIYPIDGSVPEFQPRTPEEMKKIEDLVKAAVGFKEGRDKIAVHNMMFQLDPIQVQEIATKKEEDRQYVSTLAVSAAVALAIALFFAFVVRPYFRWLSYDPERKAEKSNIEEYKPDLDIAEIQNVKIQEDIPFEKLSPQDQVLYLAKHEPKRTTEALRMLLNPSNF